MAGLLRSWWWLLLALTLGTAVAEDSNVTILAVGPFGEPLRSCRVEHFRSSDPEPQHPVDFKDHFSLLVGKKIPMGEYEAFVKCSEGPLRSRIALHESNQFEMIAMGRRVINGELGDAKLVIRLDGTRRKGEIWWVRLVGLYNQENYTDQFSGEGDWARLDLPDPGTYLVTVLSTSGYVYQRGGSR